MVCHVRVVWPASITLVALCGSADQGAAAVPPPVFEPEPLVREVADPPFRARRRTRVTGLRPRHTGLTDLDRWAPEPTLLQSIDPARLATALGEMCPGITQRRLKRYAGWMVDYAERFGVDPLLLGAVVYRQSRCQYDQESDFGIGLTRIHPRMHGPYLKKGVYTYWVLGDGAWEQRTLDVSGFRFTRGNLKRPKPNLYFAAALLRVHSEQCPANDGAFGSVPHRHFVSHFAWGDRVRGAGGEDRVLQARRRLLTYYTGEPPVALAHYEGLPLLSPLDGAPRKVTSTMGEDRAGGQRAHKGIDFASSTWEPVRAIAAGRVVIAGVDRKRGSSKTVHPDLTATVKPSEMGPGGLWVMLEHSNGLRSAYMHLSSYRVRTGQRVKAGELIGRVGRSGIRKSAAHLHFELRRNGKHLDPMPHLAPYLIEPTATWRGLRVEREQKRTKRRRRIARRRAARAARAAARAASVSDQARGKITAPASR